MAATPSNPEPPTPAFEMRNVTVTSLRDASVVVLEHVNWTVMPGEYWAIGGLLRSGKSDLLALAAGISRPAWGVHHLFGKELVPGFEQEHLALRLRIGLVFDGGQLLHHLTLLENIALPLLYHRGGGAEVSARVQALLEFTGLEPWADSSPATVTRNWQQRIGLARALASGPEVLLLDNPLTGLDPRDAQWWLETLENLAAGHAITGGRPLTLVVTGDDLRPWHRRARQFAVLKNQQFIPVGARAGLAAHHEPLLQELLHAQNNSFTTAGAPAES